MGRSKFKKTGCKDVTANKLLPLSAATIRETSLQNHLALEALRSRYGSSLHATFLFRAVYLTWLLRDAIEPGCEVEVFQEAESVLYRCSLRAEEGRSCQLDDVDIDALKIVLTLHDLQLQSVSARVYEAACARLLEYLTQGGQCVIPASPGGAPVQRLEAVI